MNRTREHSNLVSKSIIFADVTNDRVGVGTTFPATRLSVAGAVTAVDFNTTSDERLKTNIKVIDGAVEKIERLSGVTFEWKDSGNSSVGVIAQDIEKVFPELVVGNQTKTVNYNGLVGVLIEAVKSQQKQIDVLMEEIEKLAARKKRAKSEQTKSKPIE